MLLMFAVNDHRNGAFTGRCDGLSVGLDGDGLTVELPSLRCVIGPGWFRLGRRCFQHTGHREWVGNWCWDAVTVSRATAERVLEYARQRGGQCTVGPCDLYDAWQSGLPLVLTKD